jgi:hypothetical protein
VSVIRRASNCSHSGSTKEVQEFTDAEDLPMGKGILLWLLGIPIPILILILLFWH